MKPWLAANLMFYPATRVAGERVRAHLREYCAHDKLTRETLFRIQQQALARVVDFACEQTTHYRSWNDTRSGPSSVYPTLDGVPLLEKSLIRDHPGVLASQGGQRFVEHKTTSGSTGHPVTVAKDRDALARERAATWRAYGWAGLAVAAPQALLWGVPHTARGRLRARVIDILANRRRLPFFGIDEASLQRHLEEVQRFRPHFLYGYVSAVAEFVRFLTDRGERLPDSLRCIITTSELLDPATRALIEEGTGLRVFNEYGCGEVGSIAHECEAGALHIMSDNLVLECLPGDGVLPEGLGELVVTDLYNRAMPLLRYRLGDLGQISHRECACGRPYPILERIVGRAYDTIVTRSGKSYHPEAILYVFEDLRRMQTALPRYQAIQYRAGELEIRFETPEPLSEHLKAFTTQAFRRSFGDDLSVEVYTTREIQREPSGKLRIVKRIEKERMKPAPS